MKIKQLSVFMENRSGRLAHVTRMLGKVGINIRALTLADTSNFGILRLIVNDPEKAADVLKENGFTVHLTDVIAVEILDRPGELSRFLDAIEEAGLNVEYMYAFVEKRQDMAIVVFRFEDPDQAIEIIRAAGINILKGAQVYNL